MPVSDPLSAAAAFLIGLFGSVHCVGMCGGIVGALTMGLPEAVRASRASMVAYLLAYNIGRITSYAIAGLIVGALGAQFYAVLSESGAMRYSHWIAGAFMVALGVYLAGWTRILGPLERGGAHLWRRIEPLGRRFLPVKSPGAALSLGLVWGWLPCGLVYSTLVWAMVSGEALRGAQVMIGFGLGTSPMLLFMGAVARWLADVVRNPWVRRTAGALVVAFGVLTIVAPGLFDQGHGGHMHHHAAPP